MMHNICLNLWLLPITLTFGSHGIYGAAVGQEAFGFSPTADLFAPSSFL